MNRERVPRYALYPGGVIDEPAGAASVAPLTNEQIDAACADVRYEDHQDDPKGYDRAIARAVLAASGVTIRAT